MSDKTQLPQITPTFNVDDYTITSELWSSLKAEIQTVVTEIDSGAELLPEDVKRVRALRKQVDEYVAEFGRAMRKTQDVYKSAVAQQLTSLGYDKVETYITSQRKKQDEEVNARTAEKMQKLADIVATAMNATDVLKTTVLATELLPTFHIRFPKVKSGAKDKDITDWEPYETIITKNLELVDKFLQDENYADARYLPVYSQTMQQLLRYFKDGNVEHLSSMKAVYANDAPILEELFLRKNITTKAQAITLINQITSGAIDMGVQETLLQISKIVNVAISLND